MLNSAFLLTFFLHLGQIKNTMKHFYRLLLLFSVLTLTSCSTILHRKQQKVNVFSNAENATITVNDSVYQLPAKIKLLRDKTPVTISYQSANKQLDTIVNGKLSPVFKSMNLTTAYFFGVGYLVDLTNKKRFSYPSNIFFNDNINAKVYENRAEAYIIRKNITDNDKKEEIRFVFKRNYFSDQRKLLKKQEKEFKLYNPAVGKFRIFIAPPTLSLIGFSSKNPNVEQFNNFVGGIGFGFGADYFYKENKFISAEISNRANQFDPFYWSDYDVYAHKLDLSVRKAHKRNRFEYSYGLSFTYTDFEYKLPREKNIIKPLMTFEDDDREGFKNNYVTLGFSTLANYQISSIMFIGLRYNPSFYSFRSNGSGFDYEHVISIDYRLKF